jgi:tripartite-type tricarboxylate transporter receptor subunit TctC
MQQMVRLLLSALIALAAPAPVRAQEAAASFPNRAIRLIVPFPAGGPADIVARLIGQKMSEDW